MKNKTSPKRFFREERLALFLLRLWGVYFLALAFFSGMTLPNQITCAWKEFHYDEFFAWQAAINLAIFAAELMIGFYCVLGGQWLFNRLLAPINHRPKNHDLEEKIEEAI
jgi:hypothetical protein